MNSRSYSNVMDDPIKVTLIHNRSVDIQFGDCLDGVSVTFPLERLPEVIGKLQAFMPAPETEKIRTMRYITLVADEMPHSVIAEIAAEMMRGTK